MSLSRVLLSRQPANLLRHGRVFSVTPCLHHSTETPMDRSQRLGRPLSPYMFFKIYTPQLTWVLSGAFRVSSVVMTAGIYAGAIGYVCGSMDAQSYLDAVRALQLPTPVYNLGKFVIAFPVSFHFFNGIRHMIWDSGRFLELNNVYKTGWTVLAVTTVTAGLLAII